MAGVAVFESRVAEADDESWDHAACVSCGWSINRHRRRQGSDDLFLGGRLGGGGRSFRTSGGSSRSLGASGRFGGSSRGGWLGLSFDLRLDAHDDDDISGQCGADAFWELDFADMNGLTDVEMGNVDGDVLREIFGKAAHFQIVMDGFDQTAEFDTRGYADDFDWHFGMDLFIEGNGVEIDMGDTAFEVIVLHFLDQRELLTGAEFQADEDVVRGAALKDLGEDLGVHLHVRWGDFTTIDDGWGGAGLAQAFDSTGAGDGAGLSDEVDDLSHGA